MSAIYPKGPVVKPSPPPFDEALCGANIIQLREARPRITRQLTAGKLIHVVGGTVKDIYRVWDEIEAERKAMKAVPLQAEGDYLEAISTVGFYIDPILWVAGKRSELGVGEIKAPVEPAEL